MVTSSWTTSSSSKMKSRSYERGGRGGEIPKSLTTSKHGEKVKVKCNEEVVSTGGEVIADVTGAPFDLAPDHQVDASKYLCSLDIDMALACLVCCGPDIAIDRHLSKMFLPPKCL